MEEDFYATIKLKTGEEIFCLAAASEESDRIVLILSNPIIISEIKTTSHSVKYKIEPWLKTTTEDMFIINLEDVLTLTESSDIEMIDLYQNYIRQINKINSTHSKLTKEMGYISNIHDAKIALEKIFKNY